MSRFKLSGTDFDEIWRDYSSRFDQAAPVLQFLNRSFHKLQLVPLAMGFVAGMVAFPQLSVSSAMSKAVLNESTKASSDFQLAIEEQAIVKSEPVHQTSKGQNALPAQTWQSHLREQLGLSHAKGQIESSTSSSGTDSKSELPDSLSEEQQLELATLDYAQRGLRARALDRIERLEIYRERREREQGQIRRQVRELYKLSRGGSLQLLWASYFGSAKADVQTREQARARIETARSIRHLYERKIDNLRELTRTESQLAAEWEAASKDLKALASLYPDAQLKSKKSERVLANGEPASSSGLTRPTDSHPSYSNTSQPQKWLLRPTTGDLMHSFGVHRDPLLGSEYGTKSRIDGVEFSTTLREAIRSPASGEVLYVGDEADYGQLVMIKAESNYRLLIGRLREVSVQAGDQVEVGQSLGKAYDPGNRSPLRDEFSGRSARAPIAPSVYVELRYGIRPVDPMPFMTGRLERLQAESKD